MSNKVAGRMAAAAIAFLLLLGIGRAATSRYREQLNQLQTACEAERKRLGLDGNQKYPELKDKYPTPTISLARGVRAAPGDTVDIVVKGRFVPGTKFLFDNDWIEVISEALELVPRTAEANAEKAVAALQKKAQAQTGNVQAEMEKIGKKMEDPNTSIEEKMRLAGLLTEMVQRTSQGLAPETQQAMKAATAASAPQPDDTYRAKIRISKFAGPGNARLMAVAPVSGIATGAGPVVWISGKFAWELTSSNGLRIKLTMPNEPDAGEVRKFLEGGEPIPWTFANQVPRSPLYHAEFYRGSEARPYKVRDAELLHMREDDPEYHFDFQLIPADEEKTKAIEAEIARLDNERNKVVDKLANAPEADRERIQAEAEKLQDRINAKGRENGEIRGWCSSMIVRVVQGEVSEGSIECPGERGSETHKLTGTMKLAGR